MSSCSGSRVPISTSVPEIPAKRLGSEVPTPVCATGSVPNEVPTPVCATGSVPNEVPAERPKKYIQWRTEEQEEVLEYFNEYINGTAARKLPSKEDIGIFLQKSKFVRYDWMTVKTKVNNETVKAKQLARKRETKLGICT